jgi:hypothetical protein
MATVNKSMSHNQFSILFESHINEFTDITKELKNSEYGDVELVKEASDILQAMRIEIHFTNFKNVKEGQNIIKKFTKELELIKKNNHTKSKNKLDKNKTEKYTSQIDDEDKSLMLLKNAHSDLLESETRVQETLINLREQREKLEKIRIGINETNNDLSKSNWFIKKMSSWWRG